MIQLLDSQFLLPTKQFRHMSVLLSIHADANTSQHILSEKTGLSVSMVNGYIKKLAAEGIIDTVDRNCRDKEYYLTQRGKEKLNNMLFSYSAEIVRLYGQARGELVAQFRKAFSAEEEIRVALFGAADTADLVIRALSELEQVRIVAVVDNDSKKWWTTIGNHEIWPPDNLKNVRPDTVIITSFGRQEEIYRTVCNLEECGIRVLRLTPIGSQQAA